MSRKAYPSDVTDEGWEFAAPYLTLMEREDGMPPQRGYPLPGLKSCPLAFLSAGFHESGAPFSRYF